MNTPLRSICAYKEGLYQGDFTSRELVLSFLRRICRLDSAKDGLNSVAVVNPDALFLADAVDAKLASQQAVGSLAGMPIIVKANISSNDMMPTTAGSLALQDNHPIKDSFLVKKLRESDAILLGKANMTEFANFMSYRMPSGYSSLGGQVRNPHNPAREPGGSSSGSAVAMAAQLAAACIGTETNASIIWPAQANGVVGLKPSIGLVSRTGIIPISHTLDTAGPITACTRDAALIMNAICGYDPDDPATYILANRPAIDFTEFLDAEYLKGKRIGLYHAQTFLTDEQQQTATRRLIDLMEQAGAQIIDNCPLQEYPEVKTVEKYEFKVSLNTCLSESKSPTTLKEILMFNEACGRPALRYGQDRMEESEVECTGNLTEPDYLQSLLVRADAQNSVTEFMNANNLDAILCTGGITNIAPFTGMPSMTIPIGYRDDNSPIGCCMMARHLEDAQLLGIMYALEKLVDFSPLSLK